MPQLDVVGVIVSDLHRAAGFYARLGIRFPQELDPLGQRYAQVRDPDGSIVDLFAPLG